MHQSIDADPLEQVESIPTLGENGVFAHLLIDEIEEEIKQLKKNTKRRIGKGNKEKNSSKNHQPREKEKKEVQVNPDAGTVAVTVEEEIQLPRSPPIRRKKYMKEKMQQQIITSENNLISFLHQNVSLCAFKPLVIQHALQYYDSVLWLDANIEIRRPLTEIWQAVEKDGYFLTTSGHLFPSSINVRPQTLDYFNCTIPYASEIEYTSAVIGVKEGSILEEEILPDMVQCAKDTFSCHYPKGSESSNQRRDQSTMNAAICKYHYAHANDNNNDSQNQNFVGKEKEKIKIHLDKKWWMWSDQATFLPPSDEKFFNDMVLYFRRGHGGSPYKRYLKKYTKPWYEDD